MKFAVLCLLATATATLAAPQRNAIRSCGSSLTADEIMAAEAKFKLDFAAANSVDAASGTSLNNIPVAWHVIYKSMSVDDGYMPDSAIADSISTLNSQIGAVGFNFHLSSTDRTNNPTWFDSVGADGNSYEFDMKQALHVGGPETLNVYSVGFSNSALLGIGSFPWDYDDHPTLDGVIILHSTVPGGSCQNYNQGKTLTHELGHWLGLYHVFQGGCDGDGDYVSDTPPQSIASFGCPSGQDSCPGGGQDLIHNYMDYSDDTCMNSFTSGQISRAISQWATYRGTE